MLILRMYEIRFQWMVRSPPQNGTLAGENVPRDIIKEKKTSRCEMHGVQGIIPLSLKFFSTGDEIPGGSVSTIGGGGDTTILSPRRSPKQPLPGIGLHDPLHCRQACPESKSFNEGVDQISPRQGLFLCRPLPKRGQICDIPPPPPIAERLGGGREIILG